MVPLRGAGKTFRQIAGELNRAGVQTATVDVNHGVQDLDEIVERAKLAAKRLGITLPLHLFGRVE